MAVIIKQNVSKFNRAFDAVFDLGVKTPLRPGETLIDRYEELTALEEHHTKRLLKKEALQTISSKLWDEFIKIRLQKFRDK